MDLLIVVGICFALAVALRPLIVRVLPFAAILLLLGLLVHRRPEAAQALLGPLLVLGIALAGFWRIVRGLFRSRTGDNR